MMNKRWLVTSLLLVFSMIVFGQSYPLSFKIPIGATFTERYGIQVEIPFSDYISFDGEARYLGQDWLPRGGEPFRALTDSRGVAMHSGLRYYLNPVESTWRFFGASQYRFRYTDFVENYIDRAQHEANLMGGMQFRAFNGRFVMEMEIGGATVYEFVQQLEHSDYRQYYVPRVEFLIGFSLAKHWQ